MKKQLFEKKKSYFGDPGFGGGQFFNLHPVTVLFKKNN